MCVDIMHDPYEGVCRYVMAKVLYNLIKKYKLFSLNVLNFQITNFDYGSGYGKNIPTEICLISIKNGILIKSASEMETLVQYLGLYIG